MNRREWLQRLAQSLGGAASVPAMLALLEGCAAQPTSTAAGAVSASVPPNWKPQFFDAAQAAIVAGVAQVMIPKTDTPGAIEAGVPAFIDRALQDTCAPADQDRYRNGIAEFDAASRAAYGKAFVDIAPAQREVLVRQAYAAALADGEKTALQRFLLTTRELAMLGFFTSHAGATEVLQFVAIPGKLEACIPLAQAGNARTWAE